LAGLKVRTPGGVITDMLKAFGMVPVQVFLGDAYMAWERGLIEAWHHSPGAAMDYGLYQAGLKSVLCYNTNIYTGQLIFNKKKLASLPQEIQGIIRKVGAEFDKVWVDSGKRRAEEAMALYRKVGADIYNWPEPEMNKLRNATVPIWKKFIEDKEARGLPGRQLVRDFVNIANEMGQKPIYSPE
jgi:TRAP-type C4-dicarboxylate transport system substrate-binding protein